MSTWLWLTAIAAGILVPCAVLGWWLTRPPKVGDSVSTVWLNEHVRERRDGGGK